MPSSGQGPFTSFHNVTPKTTPAAQTVLTGCSPLTGISAPSRHVLVYCTKLQYRTSTMSHRNKLTPRQRQVYDFVRTFVAETDSAPTLDEISRHFRFRSSNSARQHLRLIAQKGHITLSPGRARGIRLKHDCIPAQSVVLAPLVGRIAAGDPIGAIENTEARIPVPADLWRGNDLFALRVQGDSMVDAGIYDGDIAIVNAQPVAENGEIVAIVIGEEITLKRFYRSIEGIRLRPENSNYPDMTFSQADSSAIRLAGVLVGTLRTF